MGNQNVVLMKGENNISSGEKNVALELNYRNGDQRLDVKVFFAKAWHDIINGFGYVLHPFRRKIKVNLNKSCIYLANNGVHLTRIRKRKTRIDHIVHRHFVDVVTGAEFCEYNKCENAIPFTKTIDGKNRIHGVIDSPINYLTSEEYINLNASSTSNEEKLAIIYSMLQRANEEYIDESKVLSKKR